MKNMIDRVDYMLERHPFISIAAILFLACSIDSIVDAAFRAIGV